VPAVAGGPQTLYGRKRGRDVDASISEGRYQRADERMLAVITGLAAAGGLLLIVLILVGR
jgi:hypothetical protein